jgi:MoaA/NifB/PqqE/SkfB family radical SAM enzyme
MDISGDTMDSDDKKPFCLLPFVHMKLGPSSKAQPCCMYDYFSYIGDLDDDSINAIWNGGELRKIRISFLNGIIPEGCRICFSGNHPYRNIMNDFLSPYLQNSHNTKSDGAIDMRNLVSLDLRMSNLCNCKCRMCNHESSSALYENDVALRFTNGKGKIIHVSNNLAEFDRQLERIIPNLYHIYLTGGEPLINGRNHELLDKFIQNNQRDIKISYNSNLNELNYKNHDVVKQWKFFSDVRVYASIDAIKDKAEYIRHGSHWNKIMRNIQEIKTNLNHMKDILNFASTLSVYNAFDIINLHRLLIEEFSIADANIEFYFLFTPRYLDIRILPSLIKRDIEETFTHFITYLTEKKYSHLANNYKSAIQYIYSDDKFEYFQEFKIFTKKLDTMRKESFETTFPEFMKYKEFTVIQEGR